MRDKGLRGFWAKRRRDAECRTRCSIVHNQGRIHVAAPKSMEFDEKARMMGGKWRARSKVWSFSGLQFYFVRQACLEVYGHVEGWAPPEDQ